MLRIAFIAPYPPSAVLPSELIKPKYRSGEHPATWVRTLSEALIRHDEVELRVFSDNRGVTRTHRVISNGVDYTFVPKIEPIRTDPIHGYLPGARRMRRAMADFKPDIVQGFGIEGGCGSIATLLPYTSIVFIQGIIEKTIEFRNISPLRLASYIRNERSVLFRGHGFIAETAFARNWVSGHNPKAHVQIIPHAMDMAFLANTPTFTDPNLLCVGSLNRIKGPDTVIRAFARLEQPDARLLMAGDGFLRTDLESLTRELNIEHQVIFLGHQSRDQLLSIMSTCRGLVLGSRMDTSPNVVTEAHAAGLPVIGTRTGGIPDMITDGSDGFLVAVDDDEAMAVCMRNILDQPGLGEKLGQHGREKVKMLNDPDRIAREHVDFYREVLRRQSLQKMRSRGGVRQLAQQPIVRKVASVVPLSLRMGNKYWWWLKFLKASQHWSKDQITEWQFRRLREMLDFAYRETDGYRQLYKAAGITPEDIRSPDDFRHVPFVTKEMIRDNLEGFSSRHPRRRYGTTGGSTGIPFGFYHSNEARQIENAFMHSCWSWVGWKLGTQSGILRGGYVGSPESISQYDPYLRELRLSSYFLTSATLPKYVEAIKSRGIAVLQAYPSSLNLFCDLLRQNPGTETPPLQLILLGSENIYDWQMEKFRATFPRATIFGWYGQSEQVILAPWCEKNTRYHARPFYSYTELLNDNNDPVSDGEEGELVGTNFHNLHTPFIRYRTMDRAVRGGASCPDCGRQFMVLDRIIGRAQEVIVTSAGRYISMTAINMHDELFDGIRQFQFYQDSPGHVTFKYVPSPNLTRDAPARIREKLKQKLGTDVQLTMKHVSQIPRTRSGKFRFLDQRLEISYGDRDT
ncbi:MAG TPA: glycosyltransferase [Kiritimatiellia bacterium]|nr:glycosyltransferase [Kiritimatiellia bacterium]